LLLRGRGNKSPWILIILLVAGLIIGGLIGDLLKGYVPILDYTKSVGLKPTELNLGVISITFGFLVKMNLAALIGLVLAMIIFKGV
jgi:hypothetical protein